MRSKVILLFIIVLAFFLRFYKITQYPPSLYWDEVSLGYNAYSILSTGADEYGVKYPFIFEAFQENKLPGYIYSVVVSIAVFGLNELSVRFPAVIFATASVYAIYLISQQLVSGKQGTIFSALSALFFAISPWSIQFSRAGFEATGGVFFALLGIYFFLSHKKILSCIFFAVSCYFYYQFLIFSPLLFISLTVLQDKNLKEKIKINITVLITLLVLLTPLVLTLLTSSQGRIHQIEGPFTDLQLQDKFVAQRIKANNSFASRLIHNRFTYGIPKMFSEYRKHFTSDFLFKYGDLNQRHRVDGTGVFYKSFILFMLAGIWSSLQNRKLLKLILPWITLSPLAASLVYPNPHALRAIMLNPALLILSALGANFLLQQVSLVSKYVRLLFIFLIIITTGYFLQTYLVSYFDYTIKLARMWAPGHTELFSYLNKIENKYDQIYITGKYWRPYIFFLFYNKYPPSLYQANPSNSKIGKFYFGTASYDNTNPRYNYQEKNLEDLLLEPKTLFVLSPEELKPFFRVNKIIYSPSGEKVFLVVEHRYL